MRRHTRANRSVLNPIPAHGAAGGSSTRLRLSTAPLARQAMRPNAPWCLRLLMAQSAAAVRPHLGLMLPSGGVGPAHTAAALGRTLIFVQPAPRAVLLRTRHRIVQTFKPHRASSADTLGLALPDVPLRLTLAVRTEEEQQVLATARGSILPTPVRAGKHGRLPTYLRHGSNHLNQAASNSALQWSVRVLSTRTNPVREPPLQDTTRLSDVVFPYAGTSIASASGHYTKRLAPARRFTRFLNRRARRSMPVDNDATRGSGLARRVAKFPT
jgi:hypothetical protein